MTTGITMGNVSGVYAINVQFTPASVAANTTVEQFITVPRLLPTDLVLSVAQPFPPVAGTGIVGCRSAGSVAAPSIAVSFINNTAGALTPTSGTYRFVIFRPETASFAANIISD